MGVIGRLFFGKLSIVFRVGALSSGRSVGTYFL